MKTHTLLYLALFFTGPVFAATCSNSNGSASQVNYDLSTTLTQEQNEPGKSTQMVKDQEVNVQAVCPAYSSPDSSTYRSYVTNYPVAETDGGWQYLKLDPDYLEGAMKIHDSYAGDFYPPVSYVHMGADENVNDGKPFTIHDSNLIFQIKIMKSFIGTVVIPQQTMFNVYVTTGANDPLTSAVYQISYNGTITVPQSCEINAGQTVVVNFGSLYSGDFKTAGQRPKDIPNKTFHVPIKCNGSINYPANLTLRLQATTDSHISRAIATNNRDVGVMVEKADGSVLIPNDVSSKVPFTTDANGHANVALQAYTISTTGRTPAEGPFTALANLRIDFD